jgi:multidrug efflux pump subunit AcrB
MQRALVEAHHPPEAIDDAIVVVENIVLHREAGQPRLEAIHSALGEITVPLIGSTVTPIVVFLPLISITGVTGTFFRALAVTVAVALLTSLALALTWTPNLSQYLLRKQRAGSGAGDHGPETPATLDQSLLAAEEKALSGPGRLPPPARPGSSGCSSPA